jgi:2-polyprenyl-3-methyl-5-hydroxy-6-metoxy-1,4-benzoquinol methylase
LARLTDDEDQYGDETPEKERGEERLEKPMSLNDQRLGAVVAALKGSGAKRVLDLGCGEGKLIASCWRTGSSWKFWEWTCPSAPSKSPPAG